MNWFLNISIKFKILIGYIIIILLFCSAGIFIVFKIFDLKNLSEQSVVLNKEVYYAKDLQLKVANIWQFITDASLTRDEKVIFQEAEPNYLKSKLEISQLLDVTISKEKQFKIREFIPKLDNMYEIGNKMFKAYLINQNLGNIEMEKYDNSCEIAISYLDKYVRSISNENDRLVESINKLITEILLTSLVVISCIIIVGLILGVSISNLISKPIKKITLAVKLLSDGDYEKFQSLMK